MMSLFIRLGLIVLVINQITLPCEALRGYGGRNNGKDKSFNNSEHPKIFAGNSSGLPSQKTTRKGLGVSAWGIVAIILTLTLSGIGLYYFAICYPILCKKTRKYDMIGLPSVV